MQVFAAAVRPWIWGTETDQAPRAKEKTNVPQHQDTVQFRTARDRGRNSGLGAAVRAQAFRLRQAVASKRRGLRPRGGGGLGGGAAAAHLLAHPCAGPGSRDRGREGQGAVEAEVRLNHGPRAGVIQLLLVLPFLFLLVIVAVIVVRIFSQELKF